MMDGALQESTGESATRAAHGPGVYCTPRLHYTAFGLYAMPQDVFSDVQHCHQKQVQQWQHACRQLQQHWHQKHHQWQNCLNILDYVVLPD